MSMQTADDRLMACRDCGDNFVWTAGEQAYYREHNYDPPKRCRPCRQAKKARSSEREPRAGNR